jgi:tetratricopeptide (TPR) repeat protein
VGQIEEAAEAELLLAEEDWFHVRNEETFEHFERAGTLVADRPTSVTKARVLVETSRFLMLASRAHDAVQVGKEALLLAEELGLQELRASALNNIGTARVSIGDLGGLRDLEASIALAEEVGSAEAFRGIGNLASIHGDRGDLRRARELYEKNVERASRAGHVGWLRWCRMELAILAYHEGRWAEALAGAEEFLAGAEPGHYMETGCRTMRATIWMARGETARALDESLRGLEVARSARDPQALYPALAGHAYALAVAGRTAEAGRLADELIRIVAADGFHASHWVWDLTVALDMLGRRAEAQTFLGALRTPTRWLDAARAHAQGDFAASADLLAAMGSRAEEAVARLAAAEAGGGRDQLDRAIAFFRDVGATAYLRRAETILAASA